jgi:hypothetical protein
MPALGSVMTATAYSNLKSAIKIGTIVCDVLYVPHFSGMHLMAQLVYIVPSAEGSIYATIILDPVSVVASAITRARIVCSHVLHRWC